MRRIAIVTGTRAEWGLLSPLAKALKKRHDVELTVIATNMHLMARYGMTVDEIRADGFDPIEVRMDVEGDTPAQKAKSMARCIDGMVDALETIRPDLLVVLGDRYEMLAVASVASVMLIPIVHISGGEITEGAIDNNIRHALTKLSALHLTATESYRRRVIQMGEEPERVINTGAIGVYNIHSETPMPIEELRESIGFDIDGNTLLVTYHPATLDPSQVGARFCELLAALDRFPDNKVLFTFPNNDAHGAAIIDMIRDYVARNPHRAAAIPSLGRRRYLSALHYVAAVVGNSSSGIVEVPSMHIPTVNIGIRQRGRIRSASVIDCGDDTESIATAIGVALSEEGRLRARQSENPYYRRDTLELMVDAIVDVPLENLLIKKFYDMP